MFTISLCMIVKNEQKNLARCLTSATVIADEIIIVDTGSTDATKDIATRFTSKIYDFTWIDDFAAARNFSFSQATMDYILWLDADDLILPEDIIRLQKNKATLSPAIDAVMMPYHVGFDYQGNLTFSYYRERLVKRSRNFQWQEPVHEYLAVSGQVIAWDSCITHGRQPTTLNDRNLRIYENHLSQGKSLSPRGMYYYARELKTHEKYEQAIHYFTQFLASNLGWVEDNIAACHELAKCYLATQRQKEALAVLFKSFGYDLPRGEICCQLGYCFKAKEDYRQAIFWFKLALTLERPSAHWGFYDHNSWGYTPAMELTVCYDRLKDYQQAEAYNNLAEKYKPTCTAVQQNKRYFELRKNNLCENTS